MTVERKLSRTGLLRVGVGMQLDSRIILMRTLTETQYSTVQGGGEDACNGRKEKMTAYRLTPETQDSIVDDLGSIRVVSKREY